MNALFIGELEALPDTTITLTNGKKLIVKEREEEVRQRAMNFYQRIGTFGTLQVKTNGESD